MVERHEGRATDSEQSVPSESDVSKHQVARGQPESPAPGSGSNRETSRVHVSPPTELMPFSVPSQRTPLLGRDEDIDALCALLHRDDVPLVTLTGSGGIGKTQLAIAVAAHVREHFSDVTWFVDLSSVRD